MKIIIIDNDQEIVDSLTNLLSELNAEPKPIITGFTDSEKALESVMTSEYDLIFINPELSGINGIQIITKLKQKYIHCPEFIFISSNPVYAIDAWRLDATAYVAKPFTPEDISVAVLRSYRYHVGYKFVIRHRPYVRCFPTFDIFIDNTPLKFNSKRAKELLAFLVHYRGSWVSVEKIAFDLLESTSDDSSKSYVRTILSRLRATLRKYGIGSILEARQGELRVLPTHFECDYYQYLAGHTELYQGKYLDEYSWAREESAYLFRKSGLMS